VTDNKQITEIKSASIRKLLLFDKATFAIPRNRCLQTARFSAVGLSSGGQSV